MDRMQDAGFSADVEKWDSDEDSCDESCDEAAADLSEEKLMLLMSDSL